MLTFTTFFQESDSAEYIVDCLYIDALYLAMGTHRLDICITSSTVYYNQIYYYIYNNTPYIYCYIIFNDKCL